jgi:hypothetical protein
MSNPRLNPKVKAFVTEKEVKVVASYKDDKTERSIEINCIH